MSPYSAFAYNVLNIGVIFPFVYLTTLAAWPNASLTLGILITGIFTAFLAVVYAGLASAMPRTGGDYIFQSRTIGGWIGFAIVATMIVTFFLQWQAIGGWLTSLLGLSPMFVGLGLSMNNAQLLQLGIWFSTPTGIWVVTAASSTVAAAILMKSFAWFVKAQWIMWYGFLLSFVVMVVMFFSTSNAAFAANFNHASSVLVNGTATSSGNYYQSVISKAVASGFVPAAGFSLIGSFLVAPVALTSLGWVGYAQEQAGEIQGAQSLRNQMFINLGGGLFSTVLMMILAYALVNTVGQGWLSAASYYSASMPIPPWFSNLAEVLTNNPALIILMMIGIFLNAIQVVFNVIIGWTRVALAMSIDGALPKWLSKVNDRTHTPVNAQVFYLIVAGFGMGYVYNFVPGYTSYALAVTAVATVMYIGTALGGAIFPWVRKQIYDSSPIAKYKVGSIPIITICGLIAAGFSAVMLYDYLVYPFLGVASAVSEEIMLAIFLFWVGYYFVRRRWLRRVGIDLELAYKEIPPV
jgi:amino acid transporter